MAVINMSKLVKTKSSKGSDREAIVPDMLRAMNTHVVAGDELLIPVNIRDGEAAFWESGGRNQAYVSSIGTIITDNHDNLLDAILFNKLRKTPNGKQALITIKPGYRLYVGKISVRNNELSPTIKIIRLVFTGIDSSVVTTPKATFGRFVVNEMFNSYSDTIDCFPCERLLKKLFSKDVMKPFFANGWTVSNIQGIKNSAELRKSYINIMTKETEMKAIDDGDTLLDTIEEEIVQLRNKKLSAVYQCIDFNSGMVYIKPMLNMSLSNIAGSIASAVANTTYVIPISKLTACYNRKIIFNSDDPRMLEMALSYDDKFAVNIGDRRFVIMRGYRG